MKEINIDDTPKNVDWIKSMPSTKSEEIFLDALSWLRKHYGEFQFFTERDVVWTVQKKITELIGNKPYKVFNDYVLFREKKSCVKPDLVILSRADEVELAVEFKYEPNHERKNICASKFKPSVVFWKEGIIKDINRLEQLKIKAKTAYAILIDENGFFYKQREKLPVDEKKSSWIEWGNGVWVLYSQ
ncbi:MAG: hypothetical protein WC980_07725 [Candidatus Brocadiia bacterium]